MNPQIENYTIECLSCGGKSRIKLIGSDKIMYIDHTPIISCRFRGDMKWGFECECGNDSRLAREEKDQAEFLIQGGKHALKKLIDSLKIKDEKKFRMVHA